MAGGNPNSPFDFFGFKLPRYQVSMIVLGLYVGIYGIFSIKSRFSAPPPITYESKQEEEYVKKYIEHFEKESHKPILAQVPFTGSTH